MEKNRIVECERNNLKKIIQFRLPHSFIYVGLAIVIMTIVGMFVRAFVLDGDTEILKEVLRKGLLVGLLIISISKDKVEDEMTIQLRAQSYLLAFIIGVCYALIMPYVEFGIDSIADKSPNINKSLGDFQVLVFMLMIQLGFYHNLKRFG